MRASSNIDLGRMTVVENARDEAVRLHHKADEALTDIRNERFLLTRQIDAIDVERERFGRTRPDLLQQRNRLDGERDALKAKQDEAQAIRDAAGERASAAIAVFDNCARHLDGAR